MSTTKVQLQAPSKVQTVMNRISSIDKELIKRDKNAKVQANQYDNIARRGTKIWLMQVHFSNLKPEVYICFIMCCNIDFVRKSLDIYAEIDSSRCNIISEQKSRALSYSGTYLPGKRTQCYQEHMDTMEFFWFPWVSSSYQLINQKVPIVFLCILEITQSIDSSGQKEKTKSSLMVT